MLDKSLLPYPKQGAFLNEATKFEVDAAVFRGGTEAHPLSKDSTRTQVSYCGSAKTYMALPPLGVSASGVRPTPRAAIGPPPAAMAMYWRPLTEYVTAPPTTCEGSRVCHKTWPLSASSARR